MTTPSPGSHPHTDLLAMLDDAASRYRGHGIPERATAAAAAIRELTADRDRLAARVETLEGSLAMIRRRAVEHPKGLTPGYVLAAIDTPECDLPQRPRALVVPDTPTSHTDTGLAHQFVGVAGHPDDDECTHREDGTDDTYCGRTRAEHAASPTDTGDDR